MAQNYTRQSSFADGDTITAALFNNEFNQVVNAFAYSASSDSSTGHKHDGTSGQGGNIPQIGDIDFLNKIVVDNTNNRWGFYVQVSSGTVEQIRIQDGAIVPVTNNDIDLGTSSLEFKDLFLDGTAHIDTLDVDVNATVAGTLGVTGASTLTGNVTATNDLSVGGNLTVTGNATIAGNLTFGDAATDTVAFSADIASNFLPSADNTYDLGASGSEWKDLYIDGTANIDSLVADTADINGGTIDSAVIGGTTPAAITGTVITAKDSNGAINLHRTNTAGVAITQLISDNVGKWQVGMQGSTDDYSVYDVDASANRLTINATTGAATFNSSVTATGTSVFASLDISGDIDVDGTANLDVVDIDGAVDMATTLTVAGNVDFNGDLDVDGTTNLDVVDIDGAVDFGSTTAHAGNATFADNAKAIFGAGSDLQIYHTGSVSVIEDSGTGNLLIRGTDMRLQNAIGSENFLKAVDGAEVELMHGGATKLATTASGIAVTGNSGGGGGSTTPVVVVISDTDTGSSWASGDIFAATDYKSADGSGAGSGVRVRTGISQEGSSGATSSYIVQTAPATAGIMVDRLKISSGGDLSLYEDTGTTPKFVWDASAERLGIGTDSPSATFNTVSDTIWFQNAARSYGIGIYADDANLSTKIRQINSGGSVSINTGSGGANQTTFDSSGKVGIGTNSPSETLSVESTSNNAILLNSPANRYNAVGFQSAGVDKWWVGRADTDIIAGDAFFIGADAGNATDAGGTSAKLVVNSSGSVGIGTSSPASTTKLHISGAGTQYMRVENTNTGVTTDFGTTSTGSTIINRSATPMMFFTDSTERLRIDSAGAIYGSSGSGYTKFATLTTNYITVADDATVSMTAGVAGAIFIHVYDQGSGDGGVYFATYKGQPVLIASQGSNSFVTSDTDGSFCIIKNSNSHGITFKNRTGVSKNMAFLISGANAI